MMKSRPPTRTIDSFLRFMGLTDTHQKENKGHAASKRRLYLLAVALVTLATLLGAIHLCFPALDQPIDHRRSRVMRHAKAKLGRTTIPRHRSSFTKQQQKEFILAGKLNLIDIRIDRRELEQSPEDSYDGVYGTFCQLNFAVHKADPSEVPMFRDLVTKSPMCAEDFDDDGNELEEDEEDMPRGRIEVNLKHLADMAQEAEDHQLYPNAKNLALTGVVFHESRCGSTLVANSLIGMNPAKHRVYSESAPPIVALSICGDNYEICTLDQAAQILRDVLYFMNRSSDSQEERVFYKIQSAGTRGLDVFRKAFPHTPWLFVYRDPVQVMMSHFAKGTRSANCLRAMHHPPRILVELARRRGYTVGAARTKAKDDDEGQVPASKGLSPSGFCAAHLATLTETAVHHIQQSDGIGRAINYVNLPHILYEKVLPSWGVHVSDKEIQNIHAVSSKYSKGRGEQREFHEDSEEKEKKAGPEIKEASKIFLQESYEKLEKLSQTSSRQNTL